MPPPASAAALAILGATALLSVVSVAWVCRSRSRSRRRRRGGGDGYAGLIGGTPMIRLKSLSDSLGCNILAKVEFANPGGTGKDRIALNMIAEAEADGRLREGGTVVEGTSGSTGISLACLCRSRGYACIIVVPDDQAQEKADMLHLCGAQVVQVRTAAISSPDHYVNIARRIAESTPGAVFMDQFETAANFNAHYESTGPEIWAQCRGQLHAFVMGAGTGGTIAGVSSYFRRASQSLGGRFLTFMRYGVRSAHRAVKIVLVDPPGSSLYNRVKHGVCYTPQQAERKLRRHRYDTIAEGIGLDRMTANFRRAHIDDAIYVDDQDAVRMAHFLLRNEGLLVGCSSAMNCVGAARLALELGPGHTIVTVLCDHGSRYMSRFWNKQFIADRGLEWPADEDLKPCNLQSWLCCAGRAGIAT